jgi:predicted XRE-type DNA-binding protein
LLNIGPGHTLPIQQLRPMIIQKSFSQTEIIQLLEVLLPKVQNGGGLKLYLQFRFS